MNASYATDVALPRAERVPVPIKFTKASRPYLAGETAWFDEVTAASYIKQGFAVRDTGAGEYVPAPKRAPII